MSKLLLEHSSRETNDYTQISWKDLRMDKSKFVNEEGNNRFSELLNESEDKTPLYEQSIITVKGAINNPWLEDVEWHFLNELNEDYKGVEINEAEGLINFIFSDVYVANKAKKFIKEAFIDIEIV
jgi:hypothetical protein